MVNEHAERFAYIIEHLSKSQSDFSRTIGKSNSAVSNVLASRNKAGIDLIEAVLHAYPLINSDWLLLGIGEPLKKKQEEASMWQTLKESYDNRIEELMYTINLQKKIINGDLGKFKSVLKPNSFFFVKKNSTNSVTL